MPEVDLKLLDDLDLPILLAWAHMPEVWKYLPTSRQNEKLTWDEHNKWFHFKRNCRVDWIIITQENRWKPRPVGVVHIVDLDSEHPEIGLYIGDINLWGRGVGKQALKLAIEKIEYYSYIRNLYAVIRPENKRSIRLFESLGFNRIGKARKGQGLYERSFSRPTGPIPIHSVGNRLSYSPSTI